MHIVFDARIHLSHITGISKYIINLLLNILKIDNQNIYTILINPTLSENDLLIKTLVSFENVNFQVVHLPHFGPVNYIQMPSIIRKIKPSVYHYPHLDAPISGIPTIATIHDSNFKNNIKKYNDKFGIKTLYFKYALKNTLTKSNRIVFVSESMKNDTLENNKDTIVENCRVIYNGLEKDFNEISAHVILATKEKYQLPDKFFLFVGQLREHKNIKRIIDAFNRLNQQEYKLILAGYNYPKNNIKFDFTGVRYIGMVSDEEIKSLYKLSTCFVFPSLIEGFGIPIIEAMSLGTLVITSNIGATKEISGDAAILVNPYSTAEIQAAMQSIINNSAPFHKLREKGIARSKFFNWEESARKTLGLYQEAAFE